MFWFGLTLVSCSFLKFVIGLILSFIMDLSFWFNIEKYTIEKCIKSNSKIPNKLDLVNLNIKKNKLNI